MVLDAIFQSGDGGGRFRQRDLVVISNILGPRVVGQRVNVGYRCILLVFHVSNKIFVQIEDSSNFV